MLLDADPSKVSEFSHGKSFSSGMRFGAWLFILIAGAIFTFTPGMEFTVLIAAVPIGIIFLLIGLFVMLLETRTQILPEAGRIRSVNYFLGLRLGKWEDVGPYQDVTIMKRNMSTRMADYGGNVQSDTDVYYDVFLMNKSHLKKWHLARFTNADDAKAVQNQAAELLKLTPAVYNPQTRRSSRRRR